MILKMFSFWIIFLSLNYIECSREPQIVQNRSSVRNELFERNHKKIKNEPYCGEGGNHGCFNEGICNNGQCSCTTKGSTGKQCNVCDEGYIGDALNSTCYYTISTGFQYSFRLKEDTDKEVTKLNSKVKIGFYEANWSANPEPWAQPVIRVTVEAENPKNANLTVNSTLNVKVKTGLLDTLAEEHVAQSNNTQKFSTWIDTNQFKVGPETERKILINIYNFTTPLTIKVTVTQQTRWDFMISFINEYILDTFLRFSVFRELASPILKLLTSK